MNPPVSPPPSPPHALKPTKPIPKPTEEEMMAVISKIRQTSSVRFELREEDVVPSERPGPSPPGSVPQTPRDVHQVSVKILVARRKTQFADYLISVMPSDAPPQKRQWAEDVRKVPVLDFMANIKRFLVPAFHKGKMDHVIDRMMSKYALSLDDLGDDPGIQQERFSKIKTYLMLFCRFMKSLEGELTKAGLKLPEPAGP